MGTPRSLLDSHPLLCLLPPEARALVVGSFVPVSFPFGAEIVREGDEADALYVLASGRARVVKRGAGGEELTLNSLRAGDSFGEMGLLHEARRMATVRASSEVEAFRLDRSVLRALMEQVPAVREFLELQVKHRELSNFLRVHTAFARLPPEALRLMLAELEPVAVAAGDLVCRQGDPPGPMYVVEEGRLRVFVEDGGERRYLAYLRRGDFFGELSLFKGAPRAASVEAVSACRLLRLREGTFGRLMEEHPEFRARIEERVAQYDYKRVARVPLDFAQDVLPADAAVEEKVGPGQVDRAEPFGEDERLAPAPPGGAGRRRFPFVRQIDETDCAAASLAMVCRHFGRNVSLARIRQLVHTSIDGTSLRGLCAGAGELGLAARALKAGPEQLPRLPLPAIVHWEGNHWVVLFDAGPDHVRVADPAVGPRRLSLAEFERKWTGYAALFDYTDAFAAAPEAEGGALGWLWPIARPFAGLLARALGLALVASALQMILPVFTQVIVDRVLVENDVTLLNTLALAMAAVLGFMVLATLVQRYLLSFVAVRMDARALDFLVRRLLALPLGYFQARRTGDIQRRLEGMRAVREFLVQSGVSALTAAAELVTALALMVVYSPFLTLVFLATTPFYALLMYASRRWMRPVFYRLEDAFGKYHSHQIDAIKGIETVKALAGERPFRELLLSEFLGIAGHEFTADFAAMSYQGAVHAVTFLSMALFLWFGAREVMTGHMTIGALVAFNALAVLANAALGILLPLWDRMQLAGVLLDRLRDVFEQEPEQGRNRDRLLPVRTLEGRVRFQDVTVQFGGPASPKILDGVSFAVDPGQVVAVVGRSGSGKTTLVKCLAGLLEPTAGTIFYDGVDMRTLSYSELRRQIGLVLQENHLFADTIARNIAFAEGEPDMDRVLWAARLADAHDFIDRLPLGYETRVGETGLTLSGGQRQRVAIARALYQRPPVLIFDEATSALDAESERAVQENLAQLLEGRTAFVIAHRMSTVRDADLILVLDKGRLVETGDHDRLMKLQGLYYYLVSQQLAL